MQINLSRDEDTSGFVTIHCTDGDVRVHKFIFIRISGISDVSDVSIDCDVFSATCVTDVYYCPDYSQKYFRVITPENVQQIVMCMDALTITSDVRTVIANTIVNCFVDSYTYVTGLGDLLPHVSYKENKRLIHILDPESVKSLVLELHGQVAESGKSPFRRHPTADMFKVAYILDHLDFRGWSDAEILDFYNTVPEVLHYANPVSKPKTGSLCKILSLVSQDVLRECFNAYFKVVVTDPSPPHFLWIFEHINKYIEADEKTHKIIEELSKMGSSYYDYYVDL